MFKNMLLIIYITLINIWRISESLNLHVYQHENVTLWSCGITQYSTCFQWHVPIKHQLLNKTKSLSRIKGGKDAKDGEFPFTVWYTDGTPNSKGIPWRCSGSVINQQWIITSAHCFFGYKMNASKLMIYVGYTRFPPGNLSQYYMKAEKYIVHENYNTIPKEKRWNDIALIKLKDKLIIDKNVVNSVCLPKPGFTITPRERAVVTGWGYLDKGMPNNRRLQSTIVELNSKSINDLYFTAPYHSKYGRICGADSGAPIVQYKSDNNRAVLIGVTRGTDRSDPENICGDFRNMFFISVSNFIDWITDKVQHN